MYMDINKLRIEHICSIEFENFIKEYVPEDITVEYVVKDFARVIQYTKDCETYYTLGNG